MAYDTFSKMCTTNPLNTKILAKIGENLDIVMHHLYKSPKKSDLVLNFIILAVIVAYVFSTSAVVQDILLHLLTTC